MELHQLEYFIAIVDTGSFTRAAERCSVAQPSLSQQVKKLENEIGWKLFDRLGRRVVLTEAGRRLVPKARVILEEVRGITMDYQEGLEDGQGSLSVGFIPTVSPFVLPEVIRRFGREFPQASLEVYEDLTDGIIHRILEGEIDVGITSYPIKEKRIQTEHLLTETLLVASPPHYELATRPSVILEELDLVPFIALSEVHCLGEQVQSFCYQQDVNLDIVCHTTQLSTVHLCVAMGLGVSLVPQALAVHSPLEGVVYRTVSGAQPQRKIVAAAHTRRQLSYLAREFIRMVREEYPRPAADFPGQEQG